MENWYNVKINDDELHDLIKSRMPIRKRLKISTIWSFMALVLIIIAAIISLVTHSSAYYGTEYEDINGNTLIVQGKNNTKLNGYNMTHVSGGETWRDHVLPIVIASFGWIALMISVAHHRNDYTQAEYDEMEDKILGCNDCTKPCDCATS